jgi:hypothetical protein
MERTRNRIDLMALVEAYTRVIQDADYTPEEVLWDEFGTTTVEAIVEGCRVRTMLWHSAWQEGNEQAIRAPGS